MLCKLIRAVWHFWWPPPGFSTKTVEQASDSDEPFPPLFTDAEIEHLRQLAAEDGHNAGRPL
jgi:hypothetical protein